MGKSLLAFLMLVAFVCAEAFAQDTPQDKREAVMNAVYKNIGTSGNGNISVTGNAENGSSGQVNLASPGGSKTDSSGSPAPSAPSAGTSADWEMQKQLASARRKLTNEFNRCEEEIKKLEERNSEIDDQFLDPATATDPVLLGELTKEHTENDQKLETLLEKWEELYEKLNDDSGSVL